MPNPSEELLRKIAEQRRGPQVDVEKLKLPDGRNITLAAPSGMAYSTAIELGGTSPVFMAMVEALCCIQELNGEAISMPRTRQAVDSLTNRLGRSGIEFVMQWCNAKTNPEIIQAVNELGAMALPEDIAKRAVEIKEAQVKKSSETP